MSEETLLTQLTSDEGGSIRD